MSMDLITGVEVTSKELTNKKLITATNLVKRLTNDMRINSFRIAKTIATVAENKLYEADGYKTVHEWTEEQFGYKKSLSYSLLRIGTEETMEVINDAGKVIDYTSKLHDVYGKSFSVTQLERMSSLSKEDREELVNDGTIRSDMSCADIHNIAKKFKENSFTALSDEEEIPEIKETFSVIIKGTKSKAVTLISGLNPDDVESVERFIRDFTGDVEEENEKENEE